jgi:hypothetical protein
MNQSDFNSILKESEGLKNRLYYDDSQTNIDINRKILEPYYTGKSIKLIIIGQDPTVCSSDTRDHLNSVLALRNKGNNLYNYIVNEILNPIGISIENVYATNIFKHYFKSTPKQENILHHIDDNLELVKKELVLIPNCPIILMVGNQVLNNISEHELAYYWDAGNIHSSKNKLDRELFPFPHLTPHRLHDKYKGKNFERYIDYFCRCNNIRLQL